MSNRIYKQPEFGLIHKIIDDYGKPILCGVEYKLESKEWTRRFSFKDKDVTCLDCLLLIKKNELDRLKKENQIKELEKQIEIESAKFNKTYRNTN
jgi:hypothetical protein